MQILLLKSVYKFTVKKHVQDAYIEQAVHEILEGNIDAQLGNNIYKQRIATNDKGKSGGFRLIIVVGNYAFCVGIFAKNELDNISELEVKRLREFAKDLRAMSESDIQKAITAGIFIPL